MNNIIDLDIDNKLIEFLEYFSNTFMKIKLF